MKFLSKFDYISPQITLYYNNQKHHSSIISSIISLISMFLIFFLSIILSLDFFLHKNPTAYFYRKFVKDTGIFPFNSSSLFHFITIGDLNFYDKKAFSIIGINFDRDLLLSIRNESKFSHWIYDYCDKSDIGNNYEFLGEDESKYKNAFCIKKYFNNQTKKIIYSNDSNFNYPQYEHGNGNRNEVFYGIFVKRCQNNSLINDFFCYDDKKIDEMILNSKSYAIYFLDQYVNLENYKHPINYFFHEILNNYTNYSYTVNVLNFHPCLIKTRAGIIFEQKSLKQSYIYDLNEKVLYYKGNNDDYIYGSYYFSMDNIEDIYDRKFKMLQDVCASIGGLFNLIKIVSFFINYYFHQYKLYRNLFDDIYYKYRNQRRRILSSSLSLNVFNNLSSNLNVINKINKSLMKNNFLVDKKNNINNTNINNFNNNFTNINNNFTNINNNMGFNNNSLNNNINNNNVINMNQNFNNNMNFNANINTNINNSGNIYVSNNLEELMPRRDETVYVDKNKQYLPDIINIMFASSTGYNVSMFVSKYITFEQLFKKYMDKLNLPYHHLGVNIQFSYFGKILDPFSQVLIGNVLLNSQRIEVLDIGGLQGAQ